MKDIYTYNQDLENIKFSLSEIYKRRVNWSDMLTLYDFELTSIIEFIDTYCKERKLNE